MQRFSRRRAASRIGGRRSPGRSTRPRRCRPAPRAPARGRAARLRLVVEPCREGAAAARTRRSRVIDPVRPAALSFSGSAGYPSTSVALDASVHVTEKANARPERWREPLRSSGGPGMGGSAELDQRRKGRRAFSGADHSGAASGRGRGASGSRRCRRGRPGELAAIVERPRSRCRRRGARRRGCAGPHLDGATGTGHGRRHERVASFSGETGSTGGGKSPSRRRRRRRAPRRWCSSPRADRRHPTAWRRAVGVIL